MVNLLIRVVACTILILTSPVWLPLVAIREVSGPPTATSPAEALIIGFGQAAMLVLSAVPLAVIVAAVWIWVQP